jgi:mycothiol synthase
MENYQDITKVNHHLPDGYRVRPMSLEFAEETVALLNRVSEEFIGAPKFSLNGMIGEWKMPEVNLETDIRIVLDPEGKVAAYGELWDIFSPYVHKYAFIRVHPKHRGLGIGSYLLDFVEQRAQALLDKAPPGAKVTLQQGVFGKDANAASILTSQGFVHSRTYYTMKIALDHQPATPQIPAGIVIRPIHLDTEKTAYFKAGQEAFRDHYGFVEEPFDEYYRRWEHLIASDPDRYDPSLWLAAFDGDEIAGICFNRLQMSGSKEEGWVGMLGVRRPWRKRGIAEALLLQSFNIFYERGFKRTGLGVDASSLTGATRLYEKAGMHVTSETHNYQKVLRDGKELGTETLNS